MIPSGGKPLRRAALQTVCRETSARFFFEFLCNNNTVVTNNV